MTLAVKIEVRVNPEDPDAYQIRCSVLSEIWTEWTSLHDRQTLHIDNVEVAMYNPERPPRERPRTLFPPPIRKPEIDH